MFVKYKICKKELTIYVSFTRIRIRLYAQTFCCGYGWRPQVSNENADCSRKPLKTVSRVETFKNATNPDKKLT